MRLLLKSKILLAKHYMQLILHPNYANKNMYESIETPSHQHKCKIIINFFPNKLQAVT